MTENNNDEDINYVKFKQTYKLLNKRMVKGGSQNEKD